MEVSAQFESPAIVRWLKAKMWSKNFKEGFVWRIDRAAFHWNTNTEADVETVTQVNVAQLPTFHRQTMRLRHLEARLRHVPAQLFAERGRQITRWWYFCV